MLSAERRPTVLETIRQFAAAHPIWATFFALWACGVLFGLGCDIARSLGKPQLVVPFSGDDDV